MIVSSSSWTKSGRLQLALLDLLRGPRHDAVVEARLTRAEQPTGRVVAGSKPATTREVGRDAATRSG